MGEALSFLTQTSTGPPTVLASLCHLPFRKVLPLAQPSLPPSRWLWDDHVT